MVAHDRKIAALRDFDPAYVSLGQDRSFDDFCALSALGGMLMPQVQCRYHEWLPGREIVLASTHAAGPTRTHDTIRLPRYHAW
jgi:hypothetical protein